MAGMSVSRMSQVTEPPSTMAFTLAASGGPSSRTRTPLSRSKGWNITSRIAVVREPPQEAITISPLSARAGRTWKNGPVAARTAPAFRSTDLREGWICLVTTAPPRSGMFGGYKRGILARPGDADLRPGRQVQRIGAVGLLGDERCAILQPQRDSRDVPDING